MPLVNQISASGIKFGRTYQLDVTGKSNTTQIPDISLVFPLTLELDITHNIFAASNTGNFSLYGLSDTNRSEISFSTYNKEFAYPIVLRAGYLSQQPGGLNGVPSSLPIVFNGFTNVAYTERQGIELITRINAFDNGDFADNSRPAIYFTEDNSYRAQPGTLFPQMVRNVMHRLSPNGIKIGQVILNTATIQGKPATTTVVTAGKGRPFNGRVWEQLEKLADEAGAYVYIENGVCNMLGPLDVLPTANSLGIIQSSTGLLGIPRFTDGTITCSMIFEPSLTIGAQVELFSDFNPEVNGLTRIVSYRHHGTISGVQSGNLYSDVELMKLSIPLSAGVGP